MQEEINVNEIVKIESMAVIKQQLDKVEIFIEEKTKDIPEILKKLELLSKEEKEEKKSEIKKYKQYLSNIQKELENKRKEIKKEVNKPYEEFNEYYSNGVFIKLNQGIVQLENVVNDIEVAQKQQKEQELREFFEEHCKARNLDGWFCYEMITLNVTLSASMKSLKEKIIAILDEVAKAIQLIKMEEFADEIMLEYKNSLDFGNSKMKVVERHQQLELMKQKEEELARKKEEEAKIVEKVEEVVEPEIIAPVEIETTTLADTEEQYVITFTVHGTREQIIKLKQFLNEEGLHYE